MIVVLVVVVVVVVVVLVASVVLGTLRPGNSDQDLQRPIRVAVYV